MTEPADERSAPHGGREEVVAELRAAGFKVRDMGDVRPSEWLISAIHEALERAVVCEHLTPEPPLRRAKLVLNSGSMTCDDCETPDEMSVMPGGRSRYICDRCGVLTTVELLIVPIRDVVVVGARLCRVCISLENPHIEDVL